MRRHRGLQRRAVACDDYGGVRTDLVEATLVREDGDVSVVACTSYVRGAVSICSEQTLAWRGDGNAPDMMAAGVYVRVGDSALVQL